MKMKNEKRRCMKAWFLVTALCIMLTSFAGAFAESDSYYPGPGDEPEDPVVVVTPKPTPKPTKKPGPKPTAKPRPKKEEKIYRLTVYYRYMDGKQAAVTFEGRFRKGFKYGVVSPTIPGYKMTRKLVSGEMPARDLSFVVWYYRDDYEVLEDYDTPLGLGNVVINIGDCYE